MTTRDRLQLLPDLPPEQYDALKADIAECGVVVAIDVDEFGPILDGHHRGPAASPPTRSRCKAFAFRFRSCPTTTGSRCCVG